MGLDRFLSVLFCSISNTIKDCPLSLPTSTTFGPCRGWLTLFSSWKRILNLTTGLTAHEGYSHELGCLISIGEDSGRRRIPTKTRLLGDRWRQTYRCPLCHFSCTSEMSLPNCWSRSSIEMDGRSNPTLPVTLSVPETCLFRLPHPSNHRGEERSIKEREWLWFRGMDSDGMAGRQAMSRPPRETVAAKGMDKLRPSLSLSPHWWWTLLL